MTRNLAESDKFKVTSEYEYVSLHFKDQILRKPIYIGDFYGDPDCAIISRNEKYVVTAGCGLIVYKLQEPYNEFGTRKNPDQYIEFFREPTNIWWIRDLYQTDLDSDFNSFRFIAENSEGEFIYRMDTESFQIEKIGHP